MQKIYASFNREISLLCDLKIPVEDRGLQFGDGIYEVLRVYKGEPFLFDEHMARLKRSLNEVSINGVDDIRRDILSNIALNDIIEGMVYIQISRGTAPRIHSFHNLPVKPNVLIYATPFLEHPAAKEMQTGIAAITHEDKRWGRCDIKSLNLLANCMAQSYAHKSGAFEAILVREGMVTEGSSSNIFIVKDKKIATAPLTANILPGTRRAFLIEAFKKEGKPIEERAIKKAELYEADEIFLTSSIKEALSIVTIDQKPVKDGKPGPVALLARKLMMEKVGEN